MKRCMVISLITVIALSLIVFGINFYVILCSKNNIINKEEAKEIQDIDCVLILGAGIWGDRPSYMLEDRLLQGIALYEQGIASKIIMSGDHGQEEYDEVNVMKQFAIEKGVPSEDIFMDHAGFSTYESIYRAKEIFEAKEIIIVTQKYHMYRALYIADKLGVEAYGVTSNPREYTGQFLRDIREIIARNKDFLNCIIKPEPTYLGDSIPVSGDGDVTNDKESI